LPLDNLGLLMEATVSAASRGPFHPRSDTHASQKALSVATHVSHPPKLTHYGWSAILIDPHYQILLVSPFRSEAGFSTRRLQK